MEALIDSPFGKLAPELRNLIYETASDTIISTAHALNIKRIDDKKSILCSTFRPARDKDGNVIPTPIGLLGACKAIRNEALEMFFSTAKINILLGEQTHVHLPGRLNAFLKPLNPVAVVAIRNLTIDVGEIGDHNGGACDIVRVENALLEGWGRNASTKMLLPNLRRLEVKASYQYGASETEQCVQLVLDAYDIEGSIDRCIAQITPLIPNQLSTQAQDSLRDLCEELDEVRMGAGSLRSGAYVVWEDDDLDDDWVGGLDDGSGHLGGWNGWKYWDGDLNGGSSDNSIGDH